MSYKCGRCSAVVPKNQPRKLYILYKKTDAGHLQIRRETPVCDNCKREMDDGGSIRVKDAPTRAFLREEVKGELKKVK